MQDRSVTQVHPVQAIPVRDLRWWGKVALVNVGPKMDAVIFDARLLALGLGHAVDNPHRSASVR